MSVTFQILPEHGIVYVRYEGFSRLDDTMRAFDDYARHPQSHPGQKHLVDLSNVTGIESDFIGLMKLQAKKADIFLGTGEQTLIVYYAPSKLSYEMAEFIVRSWEGIGAVVSLVQQCEEQALTLLGLPHQSFAELLADTD
ncbi:MAG: hypothetical protein ACX93U_15555 [Salipiger thiooxidans]|jgi:hypothetical protein|uniref:hypothetical protein n=1 Tax=Salipiger thiooxidans TaxID=282683 RepID=UPI001CFBF2E7|nr:hypothetical protein [Salipiger thiooxidans]